MLLLALPAPEKFLPALAREFLTLAPIDSPHVLFYSLQEFVVDDKLAPVNPSYFYQLPKVSDSHPKWPDAWGFMTKMVARGGYVMGAEFGQVDFIWQLFGGSSKTIDFPDLVRSVQMCLHADAPSQARWFFERLDANKSGFLEKDEITLGEATTLVRVGHTLSNLVKNCLDDLPGVAPVGGPEAMKRIREVMHSCYARHFGSFLEASVNHILQLADSDRDGKLSLAEYSALRSDATMQAALKTWLAENVVKRCLDFFVQEAKLTEEQVAPFRAIDLF